MKELRKENYEKIKMDGVYSRPHSNTNRRMQVRSSIAKTSIVLYDMSNYLSQKPKWIVRKEKQFERRILSRNKLLPSLRRKRRVPDMFKH
jgi:hypothetical protein